MAKKYYFTVFCWKDAAGNVNQQEFGGDSHPFTLKEKLMVRGVFNSAVITFWKEITGKELELFFKLNKNAGRGA